MLLQSEIPGHIFPGIPEARAAQVYAVAAQFDWSARLPRQEFYNLQLRQLHSLLHHACRQSKFWRARLQSAGFDMSANSFDGSILLRLPPLKREEIQKDFEDLRAYPGYAKWGDIGVFQTSGSTGQFLRVEKTTVSSVIYDGIALLDHMWNQRRFNQKAAVIRKEVSGFTAASWSRETANLVATGPMAQFNPVGKDMKEVLNWLEKERPTYLTTWPSIARELAYLKLLNPDPPLPIEQLVSFGEMVTDETRQVMLKAFGARITDRYSSEEAGYIALQCPQTNAYHVVPSVIVEIVDDNYQHVRPGQTGRVLVTLLHSFVMPLIRYEIGDYAVAGDTCRCGRCWPVIDRFQGRERHIVHFPDGTRKFVPIDGLDWNDIAPIRQWQFRQNAPDTIDLLVSMERPLSDEERRQLKEKTHKLFAGAFAITVREVPQIEALASGKRPEFIRAI